MENKKKMSRVEQAIETMRDEIKNAILNEEIEMEFSPSDTEGYYAELRVHVDELKFGFAIADTYICYFNDFTRGMFPKGSEDFEKLTKLAKKHVKILTLEDRERINKLYVEIEKEGGMKMRDLVNKYSHCAVYKEGSKEYEELDSLSYDEYDKLNAALNRLGYNISYNLVPMFSVVCSQHDFCTV